MRKRRRRGLRREPPGGWPLDDLLVGVATLRTIRELYRLDREWNKRAVRAWDVSLRCGVSPKGAALALERARGIGLVEFLPPERHGCAGRYRLDHGHPLAPALEDLFLTERAIVAPAERARRRETMRRRRAKREATERAEREERLRAEREAVRRARKRRRSRGRPGS